MSPEEKSLPGAELPKMTKFNFKRSAEGVRPVLSAPQMPEYRMKSDIVKEEPVPEDKAEVPEKHKSESKEVVIPSFPEKAPESVCEEKEPECGTKEAEAQTIRYIGETMSTYIIVESENSVMAGAAADFRIHCTIV